MTVNQIADQTPFTTADGSTIRSILDSTNAPVENQSLAEASLPPEGATERHYHKACEEIYFILEGSGTMELDGNGLRFLCCCAPPYSHEDTFFE